MKNFLLMLSLATLFVACKTDSQNTTEPVSKAAEPESASTTESATPPKVLTEATLDLTQFGVANNPNNVLGGLKIGDLAPNFEAMSNRGRVFNLEEALGRTPIILTFFRGGWCGYCTKQLAEFKDNLKEIQKYNYARVIAVTPQKMEYARDLANKEGITYYVLPDDNHEIMKKYKVFFHTTKDYNDKVMKYNDKDLKEFNDDSSPSCWSDSNSRM